jgi:hypothetical protein
MSNPNRPASNFDGSHISDDVRARLNELDPELAAGVRRVADETVNLREGGTGRPAVGTKRRSPSGH